MDINERRRIGRSIRYENDRNAYLGLLRTINESARQRREQELADEKRRNEDIELNKRLADTLDNPGYQPMPFGGNEFQAHEDKEQQKLLQQEPTDKVQKPTVAEPEVPFYLKEPKEDSYLVSMLKAQPQFTPTGKTSKADEGKQSDNKGFNIPKMSDYDSISDYALDLSIKAIQSATSIIDDDEVNAQLNLKSAVNQKEGDPQHANFWGGLWEGLLTSLGSSPKNQVSLNAGHPVLDQRIVDWRRSSIGNGAISKNETEVRSDVGEINRYKELIARGVDMSTYVDNINRIVELHNNLKDLKSRPQTKDVIDLTKDVSDRIQRLTAENSAMMQLVKDAATYYSDNVYGTTVRHDEFGNPIEIVKGTRSGLSGAIDEINSIVSKGYLNITPDQLAIINKHGGVIKQAAKTVDAEFKKERPRLLNRMADNIRELKSWLASKYNPTEEFRQIADSVTDFNFTEAKTYTHGLSGLIGSSMSFGGYQLASTALGLTAMAATTFGSGGMATPIAASLGSTVFGVIGGHYENTAELYDNYKEPFLKVLQKEQLYDKWLKDGRDALGKNDATDDEVMYAMASGIYEPTEKIKKLAARATYGLNNLYLNDMAAVVGGEIFEAGLNFLGPLVKAAKASLLVPGAKATRFQRMYKYLHEHPDMDKITRAKFMAEKFGEKFADSELGGGIFGAVSYPLTLIGKGLEAGVRVATPSKWVRAINKAFSFSGDLMEKMPKALLGGKAIGKQALEFTSKVLGSGFSEAIEEGKQYLNGKAFQDGSYAGASDTLMDSIINDIAGGARSTYAFVGDMFGVTSDRELIANMKGGFLGGFGHTAAIQAVSAVGNTVQTLNANEFVVNNVLAHKLADKTTIQNNSYLATQTSPRQHERIMNAFDAMEAAALDAQEKHGIENLNYGVEDVREQRKAYQRVFEMANSRNVQEAAKLLDIKPGGQKYGNFVGLVMWAKDLTKDAVAKVQEISKSIGQLSTGFITGVQNSQDSLESMLSKMDQGQVRWLAENLDEITGLDITERGNASQEAIMTMLPKVKNAMESVAHLDALLTLRDQLEMSAEPTAAEKRKLRSVNRQIKRLRSFLPDELKNIETADEMKKWVFDEPTHDVLKQQFRDLANYTVDIEEGAAMQYALLGGKIADINFITSPEMQMAYQAAQEDIKDRKKAALGLMDRYIESVADDEKLEQELHDEFERYAREEVEVYEDESVEPISSPSEPSAAPAPTVTPETPASPSESPEMAPGEHLGQLLPEQPVVEDDLSPEEGGPESLLPDFDETFVQEEPAPEEEDYDAQIAEIEAANAPSTNTMFTESDVNTDFGISEEDWNKVSEQTLQMIRAFRTRFARFVTKWGGKILSKQQYSGVKGNAVKMQREVNLLRERALRDIEQYDDSQYKPAEEGPVPTDAEVWEGLHSEQTVFENLRWMLDTYITELNNAWNNVISVKSPVNWDRFHKAWANVNKLLDAAGEDIVRMADVALDTFMRVKEDYEEWVRLYGPTETTPTPPDVVLPQQARGDSWVKYTTTHTGNPSSAGYNIEDSVAVDDSKIKLQDVTANPDFIENSIIWFTLRPYGRGNKILMNVMYVGHQFTPVDVHTSEDASGAGRAWFSNVVRMITGGNGKFVVPTKGSIHRTNGIIENANSLMTFLQMGLLNDLNIYSIEYSASQDTFCIVEYQKGPFGEDVAVAYVPGVEGGRSKHEVYRYPGNPGSTKPANGGIVMMVHPPYPEADKDVRVPINVHYTPCTEGDAQLIVDLLAGEYMSDPSDYGSHAMETQVFTENGVGKGLTRMQVLRMLIRYKSSQERYSPYQQQQRYVEYDPEDNRFVILHGNFGEGVEIPNNGKFNIREEADRKLLKDFLMAHHNVSFAYDEMLRSRVTRGNESFSHPLHGLIAFSETAQGKQIFRNGGKLTFGNSRISFDEQDFGNNEHPEGISGLAWYMKNGFLQTSFIGFKNTLINFDESSPVEYYQDGKAEQEAKPTEKQEVPKPEEKNERTITEVIQEMEVPENLEDIDLDAYDPMTGKRAKVKFDIKAANEFLEKVLGEKITDKDVTEKIHEIAKNVDGFALGITHWSGRLMFDPYAPQDTVYHEAFHKLVELVLGDRTRKMLYKAYAKKMHIKYKDDAELLSNKAIREGLAEEFRFYMDNRPTIKLNALLHPFKTLREVAKIMRNIGSFRLYTFYTLTRWGAIKNLYRMTDEKKMRFLETHGAFAPFSINGHQFPSILNPYQYRNLRNTLKYFIFKTNDIGLAGQGIENLRISKAAIKANKTYQLLINSKAPGAKALEELVEGLEFIENDLRSYIAQSMGLTQHAHDDAENIEEIEGGENPTGAALEQHIRSSYEFSPLTRTSAKIKFLFSRVPKIRFAYKNGQRVTKNILNDEGLVEYFDLKYVFNTLVNHCHNCRNAKELISRLEKLGQSNAMFKYILDNVVNPLYEQAQKGDADAEGLFAQMLVSLHAQKGEYVIGKAHRSANGTWNVTIESTDSDYNAREYKNVWSMLFAGGSEYIEQTTNGYQMAFRKGTDRRYSPEVFHNIYMFFDGVRQAVLNGGKVRVHFIGADNKATYKDLDVTNVEEFDQVKDEMCNTFQKLGIQFSKDELNYTLEQEFGSSDFTALSKMFERRDTKSITPFLNWLNGCYNPVTKSLNITKNGTLNGINIQSAIGSFGFVGMLADAKYKYKHDHDQLSVLATKGNRYYVISENNLITDITDDINAAIDGDTKTVDKLKSFSYNWIEDGRVKMGSLVLKNMTEGNRISVVTMAGFRTDEKGDLGQDYAEISPAEDYITKAQLLMQGFLIFPTMSDKKTWTALKGVKIPGLTLLSRFTNLGGGRYQLSQDREVLNQLLEYAKCELAAVRECYKQVHAGMDEKDMVLNYHKGEEYDGHTIVQGARFSVLTGIYDEDGNWVSFNRIHEEGSKKYKNERDNINTAYEYFFGIPDKDHPGMYWVKTKAGDKDWSSRKYINESQLQEHLFELLSRSLQKQVEKELKYAEELGLIERTSDDETLPIVLRYRNKLLDSQQIASIEENYKYIADKAQRESLAIATFLNRVSAASVISLNEVERLYAGHPAFFKWHWNENGDLQDRSVDQHKRLGGLISTGANNVLDIPGIPEKYVCAEVDNEMIGSKMQDEIHDLIVDGEIRQTYLRSVLDKENIGITGSNSEEIRNKVKEIDDMSLDEVKEKLLNEHPDLYKIVLKNAEKKANDFREEIDVADGAAYVTDEMAEWMLRMVGSWDSKIERAFKILRGEEVDGRVYTSKDILELRQAYQDVLTTVIGNQKYTAYGFRFANGIAAPYYDKMALFPMFKVLSSGATAKVFDKMKKEGINMLMINSAVKVGSQGSKPMNLTDFRVDDDPSNEDNFVDGDVTSQNWKPSYESTFHFNTYEQEFKYIRKQFNTDPKEKELNKMGTQMTKVVMASLTAGREYLVVDGVDADGNKVYRTVTAEDVRDDIMDCINKISDLGTDKVRKRFINENGSVNIRELSSFLKEELASRGASLESIEAVTLTLDAEGEEVMYIPPVAQNSLEWIQSIVTSMINKNVIDINTPGAAFIQRSAWNMEGNTNVRGAEDLAPDIYDGRELQMINEEGSMDCVLSIDFFNDIIPTDIVRDNEGHIVYETDDEGNFIYRDAKDEEGNDIKQRVPKRQPKSFAAARQWLIDNRIISGYMSNGKWSDASANIIGSRIPTQAQSSIHALRVVDVLPVVRDTIVLPKEFTKITGADFDIDKLFLSRLYYSTKNGKASSQFNEGSHEFYANRLLNNYIALLKDSASQDKENKNRTAHSNHASIDGDTKQIKDIVKDLEESKAKEKLEPFTPYSLWANASTKTEFITGKFGIGPFALNNNSQILTMLYGVRFTSDGFLGELGMNRLDLAQDRYGGSILSWISGLINAHVDVAKDPYISRLNVNSYTYNIVNLMIRTGFGKDTFYFTTQPIMKMMATAYNNAASQFGSELSRSKARRQRDAVDKAVFDYLKSNFVLPSDVTSLKQAEKIMDGYFKKTRGIEVLTAIKELLAKDNDILHQIAKQGEAVNDAHERWNVGGVMMSTKEVQYLVYRAKQEFQPYERDLADLVKYSKIDTSKQGKNIVEQQAYRDGVKNLFENQTGPGLFESSGIREYYKKSYIEKKTANALDLFKDIMASFTIESTGQFRAQMNIIMFMLGETNPTADMYKAVSRQIMNYIRAGFFNKWAEENGIDVKGLVTGSNTIADRLDAIRLAIMTDPAYADMRAGDGSIKNYLLSALVHGFSWRENIADTNFNVGTQKSTHDNVKFIKTLNFMDEDQINDDDMAEAWDELLNDNTHEDIQKFARDLIMYAFITSGGNTGANLFKYIPNSWKLDSYQDGHAENGFAQYMQDQLEMYQNESDQMISIDPEEIILNNWHDNKFVPVVDITEGYNKYYSGRHWADTTSRPEVAIPVVLVKQNADKATDDRYIKVRRTGANPHSSRNYTIYKAVAYTTSDKLIYVMVDPKGNSFPGNTLYEMRRSDTAVRESSSIAKRGKKGFADFIRAASGTIDIENVSIADVINNFIDTVRAKDDIGKRAALLEMFVLDKELRDILEDAVNTTVAAQGDVESPNVSEVEQSGLPNSYTGDIIPEDDVVFVFGSNPEGRHGAGAAKVAREKFGAIYGQGEGLQGNSYAIPTKDLRVKENNGYRSISKEDIIKSIKKMYKIAEQNPDKKFKVAYRNTGDKVSLNGYSGDEMLAMFKQAGPIPANVYFSQEWILNWGNIDIVANSKKEAEEFGSRVYEPSSDVDLQEWLSLDSAESKDASETLSLFEEYLQEDDSLMKWIPQLQGVFDKYPTKITFNTNDARGSYHFNKNGDVIIENIRIPRWITSNGKHAVIEYTIHELTHAATSILIHTNNDVQLAIADIMEYCKPYVEEYFNKKINWTNLSENSDLYLFHKEVDFVSEFVSSENALNILKHIPAMNKNEFDAVFKKISSIIENATIDLNVRGLNLYEQLQPVFEELITKQNLDKYGPFGISTTSNGVMELLSQLGKSLRENQCK